MQFNMPATPGWGSVTVVMAAVCLYAVFSASAVLGAAAAVDPAESINASERAELRQIDDSVERDLKQDNHPAAAWVMVAVTKPVLMMVEPTIFTGISFGKAHPDIAKFNANIAPAVMMLPIAGVIAYRIKRLGVFWR